MEGFIRITSEGITHAPNAVLGPNYMLLKEVNQEYNYPVEGWWYVTEENYIEKINDICNSMDIDPATVLTEKSDIDSLMTVRAEKIKIAIDPIILQSQLTETQTTQLLSLYKSFETGKSYSLNEIFKYQGDLYKVIQAHTSQENWIPSELPALYTKFVPTGVVADWVQPLGSEDAYNLNDLVRYNSQIWRSTVSNNVWEPGIFGWVLN